MAEVRWDEALPSGSSAVALGDNDIRSLTTGLRVGLDDEHHWVSTQGDANRGTHRKGSARAYLDVQSNFSQSGTSFIGRLYVASDTSRLFCVADSVQTIYLSGHNSPEVIGYQIEDTAASSPDESYPGVNTIWVEECGVGTGGSVISFAQLYETPPIVRGISLTSSAEMASLSVISQRGFLINTWGDDGSLSDNTFHWHSLGTRDL